MFLLLVCLAFSSAAIEYPRVANTAWDVGERLTFAVHFGPIRAGTTVLSIEDELMWTGRRVARIRATSVSADWFFYRVRDSIISYTDREGLFSWKYEKYQREGSYRNNEVTVFNHETARAFRFDDGERREPVSVERFTKDVLGALYWVRAQTLEVGDVLKIPVHDGRRSYTMEVEVQKRERISVPAGVFDCLVVEPKLQSEGLFLRKGRIQLWLTDDVRHIPIRMQSAIPVGAVVASLEFMSGVKSLP